MILKITIPAMELYDEQKEEFYETKEYRLSLQHSLISLAKWEARWGKPFLEKTDKTPAETLDYFKCMTITQNIPDIAYSYIPADVMYEIRDHIKAPMTATSITKEPGSGGSDTITSELIYYWMVALQIPMECQTWHLNRLLTLVQVCNIKNSPPKKMGRQEQLARQRNLNQQRRNEMKTEG